MAATPHDDPVLRRFREALDRRYGDRVERVVPFGSRARGDARPDSDYDVAIFLNDLRGFGEAAGALAAIEADILRTTGEIVNAMPFPAGAHRARTGLMLELRRDGRDLYQRPLTSTLLRSAVASATARRRSCGGRL